MKSRVFFENCHVFFEDVDEEAKFADVTASLYRDEDGKIVELRFFNEKYDEMLIVDSNGKAQFVDVSESELSKISTNEKKK